MNPILGACDLDALGTRLSTKWATFPPGVLPAFIAEMDFDLAEPVKDAMRGLISNDDVGYATGLGLADAYCEFASDRFGWAPDPRHVYPTSDVMSGIVETLVALTSEGSAVVINPPVYQPFFSRPALAGRRVEQAPLRRAPDDRYELDLDGLDEALARPGVEAYLLCNPHNPVGRVWSRDDLLAVAEAVARAGVLLLVDEIHAPLALAGAKHVPYGSIDHEAAKEAFVFTSATKGWNIAGAKCGLAVTASRKGNALRERAECLVPSHLGVAATIAAFTQAVDWLDVMLAQLDENRRLLGQLLEEHLPAVRYLQPEASFLTWLDCRDLELGDDPASVFLERGKVALVPGVAFGDEGKGYARLNIGTAPALVGEAVARMAGALGSGA